MGYLSTADGEIEVIPIPVTSDRLSEWIGELKAKRDEITKNGSFRCSFGLEPRLFTHGDRDQTFIVGFTPLQPYDQISRYYVRAELLAIADCCSNYNPNGVITVIGEDVTITDNRVCNAQRYVLADGKVTEQKAIVQWQDVTD